MTIAAPGNLTVYFVGGELLIFLIYKLLRRDFLYWIQIDGFLGLAISFTTRLFSKVITDFSGCLHCRHPFELGGAAFSASMLWAQAMPFVALQIYEGENKSLIFQILIISFVLWFTTTIAFFCTIDLTYLSTFFGFQTSPQFTTYNYHNSKTDSQRFAWVFGSRISFTKTIHEEIRIWVKENIEDWRSEKPSFFNVELIPDYLLPQEIVNAEGGVLRRRSSFVFGNTDPNNTTHNF